MNLNLLPSKAKFQAAKIRLQLKVRMIMVILAIVWVAVAAAVIIADVLVNIKINQVKAQSLKVNQNYLDMQDNIVTSQRFKYKVKMVGTVLKGRFEYGSAFDAVSKLFPAGISIDNYSLREDGVFVITGETQGRENVEAVEGIMEDINSGQNEKFLQMNLTEITVKGGVWQFSAEVKLK